MHCPSYLGKAFGSGLGNLSTPTLPSNPHPFPPTILTFSPSRRSHFLAFSPISPALIPRDLFAVRPCLRRAVRRAFHFAVECVCHPRISHLLKVKVKIMFLICRCHLLRLVVPELLLGLALDLRHDELDVLGHQLALLPGHWLAGVSARPHLGEKLIKWPTV